MALLDHLPEFADKLDEKMVVSDVWPHLVSFSGVFLSILPHLPISKLDLQTLLL